MKLFLASVLLWTVSWLPALAQDSSDVYTIPSDTTFSGDSAFTSDTALSDHSWVQDSLKTDESPADSDTIEVVMIDSYIANDIPAKLSLYFFTQKYCRSKVLIQGKYEFSVSDSLKKDHKKEINLSGIKPDSSGLYYYTVAVTDSSGRTFHSDSYEASATISEETISTQQSPGIFMMCCFGGTIFGMPEPGYVSAGGRDYFSLSKEIPVAAIYSSTYNYPVGYFSLGYSHIFKSEIKNIMRIGYKHIFEIPVIEYISAGVNGFTNFRGFNGISPEISLGLFRLYDGFNVFVRYRYNVKPSDTGCNFHEVSIGLFSSFFTFHL